MDITWVGHSTLLMVEGGFTALTDPWFDSSPFLRRMRPPAVPVDEIPTCKLILVSHGHGDHWDKYGRLLAKKWDAVVAGPPSVTNSLTGKGISTIVAEPQKTFWVAGLEIEVVPAYHPAPGGKDAVGYVLKTETRSIYFAGDTVPHRTVLDAVSKLKPEVMLLPVGAFRLFGKKVVMDAVDAVDMARFIGPKTVVPLHYGFLKGTVAQLEKLEELKKDGINVVVLTPGVRTKLP